MSLLKSALSWNSSPCSPSAMTYWVYSVGSLKCSSYYELQIGVTERGPWKQVQPRQTELFYWETSGPEGLTGSHYQLTHLFSLLCIHDRRCLFPLCIPRIQTGPRHVLSLRSASLWNRSPFSLWFRSIIFCFLLKRRLGGNLLHNPS